MVAEQLEKLKTEKEERARAGAATPPSPAPSNDSADNRHILQPVDNPESPDSGSQVSERMSCEESSIFLANLAYISHLFSKPCIHLPY